MGVSMGHSRGPLGTGDVNGMRVAVLSVIPCAAIGFIIDASQGDETTGSTPITTPSASTVKTGSVQPTISMPPIAGRLA